MNNKKKYEIWFAVKFHDGKVEYNQIKNIEKALELLQEIDVDKSKCDAKITIFKFSKKTKNHFQKRSK